MHAEAKKKQKEKKQKKKTAQSHKDKETNQSQIRVFFCCCLSFVWLVWFKTLNPQVPRVLPITWRQEREGERIVLVSHICSHAARLLYRIEKN